MVPYYTNGLTMDQITTPISNGVGQLETQITSALNQMATNPSPSPQSIAILQSQIQLWTGLITAESSLIKNVGDTMKTVAQNMGS